MSELTNHLIHELCPYYIGSKNCHLQLDVYEVKSTEYLWQARYNRPIASRVVVEFKEGSCHQLVVSRHREEGFLRQGDQKETFVLLGVGAVSWLVGILGSLEVGTPPVSYNLERRKERGRERGGGGR